MPMKSGLQQVKLVAISSTTLIIFLSILMILRANAFRKVWSVASPALGSVFQKGADFAFYLAIFVLFVTAFGMMGILLNGYGMLIFYDGLLILLAIAMVCYGVLLYGEVRSENGRASTKLRLVIFGLSKEVLSSVEKHFKCCGIEKYTDYLNPGHILTGSPPTWPFVDRTFDFDEDLYTAHKMSPESRRKLRPATTVLSRRGMDVKILAKTDIPVVVKAQTPNNTELTLRRQTEEKKPLQMWQKGYNKLRNIKVINRVRRSIPYDLPTDGTCYHAELDTEVTCFQGENGGKCTSTGGCWKSRHEWSSGCLTAKRDKLGEEMDRFDLFCCYTDLCNSFVELARLRRTKTPNTPAFNLSNLSNVTNITNITLTGNYIYDLCQIADVYFVKIWRLRAIQKFVQKNIYKLYPEALALGSANFRGFLGRITNAFFELTSMLADNPKHPHLQQYKDINWWWGSGWDHHFFRLMSADKFDKLPKSCCRNPTKSCFGLPYDTWTFGCKHIIMWFWWKGNEEIAILFMGYFVVTAMTAAVIYIFICGIRDKYY